MDGQRDVLAETRKTGARDVCFVGGGDLFSEIVLRTVEAGLDRVRARRVPDIATLALACSDHSAGSSPGPCAMIVCDEHNAAAMLALAGREPRRFSEITQVVAYENDSFACTLLAQDGARLIGERISLLPMNMNLTTWVNLLRLIGSGGHYVPPHLFGLDGNILPQRAEASRPVGELTPREAEVLQMAAEGAPNKVIASALDLSEHTVKLHMHRVIAKLGVKNRTEASVWFHQRYDHV